MRTLLATPIRFRRLVVLVLASLLLLTTFSVAAGAGEPFIQEPDKEVGKRTAMTPFAVLQAGGATLKFSEVRLPDGSVGGIGIAQTVRAGHSGMGSVRELRGADALEVYNALSTPGMRLPSQLMKLYGKPELGRQGWALPLPLTDGGNPQEISCMVGAEPFGAFEDDVLSFGYPFVFLSEQDGPGTQPNHWFDDVAPGDGTVRRKLQGGVSSVEYFFGKVSYCYEDLYNPTAHHGRYVSIDYKVSGFGDWAEGASGQLLDPGDNVSYQFSIAPGVDWDFSFRLQITAAKDSDQFHIGATWADPDETLTIGD